jgi:hypothetical protein
MADIKDRAKEYFPNDEFKQQIVIDAINWATKELQKENAELKETVIKMNNVITETFSNLTKAKELLKQWLQTSNASGCNNINIVTDTEQFLKDSEVEK